MPSAAAPCAATTAASAKISPTATCDPTAAPSSPATIALRSGAGEIDIVAWDGETLVFIEVKTRATADFGEPDRAVDVQKRDHLRRAAQEYLRRAGVELQKARFDIVSIVLAKPIKIDWIKDAFR